VELLHRRRIELELVDERAEVGQAYATVLLTGGEQRLETGIGG
jgi:hypothetical protein